MEPTEGFVPTLFHTHLHNLELTGGGSPDTAGSASWQQPPGHHQKIDDTNGTEQDVAAALKRAVPLPQNLQTGRGLLG